MSDQPPRLAFIEVPDFARLADLVQPMDPELVRAILSKSADTSTIPFESLVTPVRAALAPAVLDWSGFSTIMDESQPRPPRRRWWWR